MTNNDLLVGKLPESIRKDAEALGISDDVCLFSVASDLTLDGRAEEIWLVVAKDKAVALAAGEPAGAAVGPFPIKDIEKVRLFQAVGSAFLQFMIKGVYVDVVRFSNARRENFDRARAEVERLIKGEAIQPEALTRPSDRICPECGLPLPARGAECPRCKGGHGLLFRAMALMKPYWVYTALLLMLLFLRVGIVLVPPQIQRLLVDKVLIPREHKDWLLQFVLALVGMNAVACVIAIVIGRASASIGTRISKELRQVLHKKLISLSVEYFDRHSAGSLMSRILYDVDYFQGFVNQIAEGFLMNLLLVVGIGIAMFVMNWQLALLVLLPVPLVIVATAFFWKYIYPRYYPLWDSRSKMAQLLNGVLSGIRMVKAFGQEKRERGRFADSAEYVRGSQQTLQSSVATFNPLMGFVFGLGGLIIYSVGGNQVLRGEEAGGISLGTFTAFLSYVGMFYGPIGALSMFSNWSTGFISAAQRVFEVLDSRVALEEDPNPVAVEHIRGEIEFRNVTFGYDPHTPVLKDVSFKIEPGQFIGIVGKSGSGKTTLVNLICRFYDVQHGQVLIDGMDVGKLSQHELHAQVALVLQEPFLLRATIRDNIAYGRPDADPVSVINAAKAANAHDFIAARHAAYDTKLGEYGAGLSGGEKQRVTIARALIREPQILILDEATSSVDTESEQEIQRALAALSKGRTTLVVAHRLSTLKNADRIFVFDNGKLVESGSHEELLTLGKIYAKLVRIQTELSRIEQEA